MPTAYAIICLGKNEMSIQTDTQAKTPEGATSGVFFWLIVAISTV